MDTIVNRMVGRTLEQKFPPRHNVPTEEKILEVRNIVRRGVLHDISFDLYRGEILGFAGLMGAGRSELARAIFGADPIDSGAVIMNGKKLSVLSPSDSIKAGIAYLSENRKQEGLAVRMQLAENVTMANMARRLQPPGRDLAPPRAEGVPALRGGAGHPHAQPPPGGQQSLRREPAEGRRGQVALLRFEDPHLRRADPRHRRRHQVRDLRADRAAGAGRGGDHHDLLRAPRDPGDDRPRHRAARGQPRSHARHEEHDARGNPELCGGPGRGGREASDRDLRARAEERTQP